MGCEFVFSPGSCVVLSALLRNVAASACQGLGDRGDPVSLPLAFVDVSDTMVDVFPSFCPNVGSRDKSS